MSQRFGQGPSAGSSGLFNVLLRVVFVMALLRFVQGFGLALMLGCVLDVFIIVVGSFTVAL